MYNIQVDQTAPTGSNQHDSKKVNVNNVNIDQKRPQGNTKQAGIKKTIRDIITNCFSVLLSQNVIDKIATKKDRPDLHKKSPTKLMMRFLVLTVGNL